MKKRRLKFVLIAAAVSFLCAALFIFNYFDGLENQSIDFRFKLRGARPVDPSIVIVTADEKSISEMGRWPWRRDVHARLVDKLTAAGAKAIVFDVLFTEPDKDYPQGDLALGRAAARSGKVVFAMAFKQAADGMPTQPLLPIPPLMGGNVHMGTVSNLPEYDGVTREMPVFIRHEDADIPSLSLAAVAVAQDVPVEDLIARLKPEVEGGWNEININFAGGYETFPYKSYTDLHNDRVPWEDFKDKIVIIGGTSLAQFDFQATPFAQVFPGLEIQATAIDNYLKDNHMRKVDALLSLALILLIGPVFGVILAAASGWGGAISVVLFVAGYFGAGHFLFTRNFILPLALPIGTVLGVYVATLFYRYLSEEKEKRWIKGTFSQYLSPKVIEVLTQDPSRLKLGGEEREMTVSFSDLAGFTTISEAMKPSELVVVLNEYLTDMSDVILKYDGVVDKYIGDAIMSFWNAPVDEPRHATLACFAALESLDRLAVLQKKFLERKLPLVDCRIGINTGSMVVGNMGSRNRFDYTVMGDSVNLASRLEGANKPFHTRIMISEFTYEKAKNDLEVRELDLLRVKGKNIPIKVYELLAKKDGLSAEMKKALGLYQAGLLFYRDRKFDNAIAQLQAVLALLPDDGPSRVYIERAQKYIAAPPPADWDGVYIMTTK